MTPVLESASELSRVDGESQRLVETDLDVRVLLDRGTHAGLPVTSGNNLFVLLSCVWNASFNE